jgi:SAM-dependent methyltransferase
MADARNYMDWILNAFGPYLCGPVLEIGVGHGSYASELRAHGPYMGVDVDIESVAEARERFPDLDFAVADITNPAFTETLAGSEFRSVVCLNVLEHIQDHGQAVKNLARALACDGHLLVIVPALPALYNDLDRLAGHHRRYRRDEVGDLMVQAGLELVRADYFNPVGGLGWWANRFMRHRSLNDTAVNSQISLFDRWLVPISRGLDPVTRTLFGQSVLAIGRKP